MVDLYRFLVGPGAWMAFIIFFGGLIGRLLYLYGLSRERDRVFYNHMSLEWGFKSIAHWLVPLASVSMRNQPVFTIVFFVFHICLLGVPLFLLAHNMMWFEAFGFSLWSMSDTLADTLTIAFLIAALFLLLRRLIKPEVRILTTAWDYTLLVLTAMPFITGFLTYRQWGPYQLMMVLHVLSGEVLLIIVPFTKLGHILLFFFTRAFIGFEMGGRRGARAW